MSKNRNTNALQQALDKIKRKDSLNVTDVVSELRSHFGGDLSIVTDTQPFHNETFKLTTIISLYHGGTKTFCTIAEASVVLGSGSELSTDASLIAALVNLVGIKVAPPESRLGGGYIGEDLGATPQSNAEVASEDPVASPEPEVESQKPEASPELEVASEDPVASPEPEVVSEEPVASPEPEVVSEEPEASPEPEVASKEPDASPEPEVASKEPEASLEPEVAPEEPDASPEPEVAPEEPDASPEPEVAPESAPEPEVVSEEPEVAPESAPEVEAEHSKEGNKTKPAGKRASDKSSNKKQGKVSTSKAVGAGKSMAGEFVDSLLETAKSHGVSEKMMLILVKPPMRPTELSGFDKNQGYRVMTKVKNYDADAWLKIVSKHLKLLLADGRLPDKLNVTPEDLSTYSVQQMSDLVDKLPVK